MRSILQGKSLIVYMNSVQLIMTIYDAKDHSLQHSWELPLIGDELVFVTAVPMSGFWRIVFTFKDNMSVTDIL